jgi:hypothetical protein
MLLSASPCWADAGIDARFESDSSFVINVSGLKDAVSIAVTVGYDSTLLTNPIASKGLFVSRSQFDSVIEEGSVNITVLRPSTFPLGGSGALANLRFGLVGGLPGKLTYLSGYYLDREDHQVNLASSIVNPPDRPAPAAYPADKAEATAKPVPAVRSAVPRTGSESVAGATEPRPADGPAPKGADAPPSGSVRFPSVLERFRSSVGQVDCALADNLFRREDAGIRQYPEVVLSDGTTPVTVTVSPEVATVATPYFDLYGAHLVRLSVDEDNRWVLTLLPNTGSYSARLTILNAGREVEFPLTVAPPLELMPPDCPEYLRSYITLANCLAALPAGTACR